MQLIEHAKEGLLNLYFSKLRTMLALLGVLVGTASVVAMVLGGELATNEALKTFKSLGTDLLAVSINATEVNPTVTTGKIDQITLSQALNIRNVDNTLLTVAPYTQLFSPAFYQGNPINGMILGVTNQFADIVKINLSSGRFISTADHYQLYCVVGSKVYEAMKQISFKEPIGQQIQIGNDIFVIVGVANPWPENSFVYANIDYSIMIPIETSSAISKFSMINNILMRLSPQADISEVEKNVTAYIKNILADKQISFRSAKEIIAKMSQESDILTVFLGLIGSISLFVGGMGVMNIMLVSVVERKREIGIRLAVGAKRKDIGALFLMESVMLSLSGGILGVLLGLLIAFIIAKWWHWEFTLFLWPPIAGFSTSVAVGIFFGFYPAYLASRLNPIEALRSE